MFIAVFGHGSVGGGAVGIVRILTRTFFLFSFFRQTKKEKAEIERKKKEEERRKQQEDAKPLSMLERKKSLGLLNAAPQSRPTLRRRGE